MNFLLTVLTLATLSLSAQAAEVLDASVDARKGQIIVELSYGGGCAEHTFELRVSHSCVESLPPACGAELVDTTQAEDNCEAIVPKTVAFSIKKLGLDKPYYRGAALTITGDGRSFKTVYLPGRAPR